ncbi:MAG: DUF4159 domain-containing protein [Bryobacteraceae bacterium]|nr:DUF4159 domain-containing protein [Bryobacteraceae bacterium]
MFSCRRFSLSFAAAALLLAVEWSEPFPKRAEYQFLRVEYVDHPQARRWFNDGRRGWWQQDWPEADVHFSQGIRRLTRIETGDPLHLPLTDDRIFDYPWAYATQTGYWDLRPHETKRLREYLDRGGFLVVDDFHGPADWDLFAATMRRVYPDQVITEIGDDDPVVNLLYTIRERVMIPGLRHLRRGPGGSTVVQPQYSPPHWRALHDAHGRLVVAINFNQDVGDAWEHADMPEYPEVMTSLAYRFGINYILYAMTH